MTKNIKYYKAVMLSRYAQGIDYDLILFWGEVSLFAFDIQEQEVKNEFEILRMKTPDDEEFGIELYVSGPKMLLISVLNVARRMKIPVVLMHYNNQTLSYLPQPLSLGLFTEMPSETSMKVETKKLVLCKGREHDVLDQYIETAIFNTMDFPQSETEMKALSEFSKNIISKYQNYRLELYITGFSPALAAALDACYEYQIPVKAMHFDKNYKREISLTSEEEIFFSKYRAQAVR